MDELDPSVLPAPDERVKYRRHWLPALTAAVEQRQREELRDVYGLSDELVDWLLAQYVLAEGWRLTPAERKRWGSAWVNWSRYVLEINVDIRPGARAILRRPDTDRVEMQWIDSGAKDGRGRPVYELKSVQIVADQIVADGVLSGLSFPDLNAYQTAFDLKMARGPGDSGRFVQRAPRRRPAPGKPLDTDFYRRLLAFYDQLIAEGRKDPAAEIARRMDEKHETVKSWLRRGRIYLGQTKKG
jgi:hypothetical protein